VIEKSNSPFDDKLLLIPDEEITFTSSLSIDELVKRLSERVVKRGDWYENRGRYEGVFSPEGFVINYVPSGQNSFVPIISGRFTSQKDGTLRIRVSLGLHPFALAFMSLWSAGWICFGLAIAIGDPLGFLCLGPVAFMYLMTILFFNLGVRNARKFLREVFAETRAE
jgi:hypothetical protein